MQEMGDIGSFSARSRKVYMDARDYDTSDE